MFILCNAGLCYFTQCVYCKVFIIFWSNNKVCGIHICFWPISFVRAVHLARFVSSVTLLIRTLKCSGTSLESSGKKETVTRSGPGLAGCPKFAHCFCNFSKLLLH